MNNTGEYKVAIDNIKEMFYKFEVRIETKFKESYWLVDSTNMAVSIDIVKGDDRLKIIYDNNIEIFKNNQSLRNDE